MKIFKRLLATALTILTITSGAHAQSIIWTAPQTVSGASDVVTTGTMFGDWTPDDTLSASAPVNGVTFQPISLPDYGGGGFVTGYGGFGSPGTANADYNYLLGIGEYGSTVNNPSSVVATISWGGMTPGDTYEVELWVEDTRNLGVSRYEYLSGGGASAVYGVDTSSALDFGTDGSGKGQFITGTFVADGSGTETIGFTPGASAADAAVAQFNIMQVRDITSPVPEPGEYAMIFLAAGLALMVGRKIRQRCGGRLDSGI